LQKLGVTTIRHELALQWRRLVEALENV